MVSGSGPESTPVFEWARDTTGSIEGATVGEIEGAIGTGVT